MNTLFHTSAGLLSENIMRIPNRHFIPSQLVQTVVTGKNLCNIGCKQAEIRGSSIAFDSQQSLKGALGEFAERYSSSVYDSKKFVTGSFAELNKTHNMLPLSCFRYYSDEQYIQLEPLGIVPLSEHDEIEWVESHDFLTHKDYLIPAFCVFLPFKSDTANTHNYMVGTTSTGIAAGPSLELALESGFLECAERHAFAQFWYRQNDIKYRQYTRETILKYFSGNRQIRTLYQNPFVRLKAFDLSSFAPLETMAVFLYFDYKGFTYQSLGCAARMDRTSALLKATMEAYQGVEYAINLMEKDSSPKGEPDYASINSFDAHFHFYNKYPHLRKNSTILSQAQDTEHGDNEILQCDKHRICHRFSREEILKTGLSHLLYTDITPIDIASIGYHVARVITPGWSLLTGNHEWPFLGFELNNRDNLFTHYPHPFP